MFIDNMPLTVGAVQSVFLILFNVALQMQSIIFDPFCVDKNTQQFKSAPKFPVY